MTTVTLSPKFQIVIPKEVRKSLQASPGMKFEVIPFEGRIELIPVQSIKKLQGSLKAMDTTIVREKDRT